MQSLKIVNILMEGSKSQVSFQFEEDFSATGIFLRGDLEEVVEKNAEFENSDYLKKINKYLSHKFAQSTSLLQTTGLIFPG